MKEKPTKMVDYIDHFIQDAQHKAQPFIISGILNREYLKGAQHKMVDPQKMVITNKVNTPNVYLERKIFNKMLPIYLSRYGILSGSRPIPGFKATTNQSLSITGALEGNNFITAISKEIGYKEKYDQAIKLGDVDGIVWVKTGIDWTKGDLISTKTTTNAETGEKVDIKINEGRPFIDIIPIHEVLIDNFAITSPDKINELVYRRPYSCDFIEKRFGFRPPKEDITGNLTTHPYYLELGFGMRQGKDMEYAYVVEYYKKPDPLYPKGRYILKTGSHILHDGVLPFVNKMDGERKIPFVPISLMNIPGHIISPTVYNQIIPMQDTYNSVKNRLLEYINHIAIGQLYYWEGSLINKDSITNKPGRMIGLKRHSKAPQPVEKSRIGSEIVTYLEGISSDMLITAGLSELQAYGISKSNMRTDGVVDKISESDDNKLTNAIDNLSIGIIEIFKQLLYVEKQRRKILTEEYGVAKADKYMLKYNLDEVDPEELDIVNREYLKNSDIILEKKITQAASLGVYNPELNLSYKSKLEILNSVNCGYLQDTLDPTQRVNYELIQWEQEEFLNLRAPIVEEFQDHEQHIAEHNIFRLSPLLQKLKSKDIDRYDKVREALDHHIGNHQQLVENTAHNTDLENAKAYL